MCFAKTIMISTVMTAMIAGVLVRVSASEADIASSSQNLVAIHDSQSPGFNRDCLSCHSAVLTEKSKDPRVPAIHPVMLPYTPGYNPKTGPTNDLCIKCHRSTDTRQGSGAGLRVQVDRQYCALCHGPSGPGKVLYR